MSKKKGKGGVAPRSKAEWVSLGISVLILAVVVGLVIALWLNPSGEPALFRIDRDQVRHEADHYYLPITITNEGDATGAQVTVEGKLKIGDDEEVASTTFDFIPARSSAKGVLIFKTEPTSADVRVASYQEP